MRIHSPKLRWALQIGITVLVSIAPGTLAPSQTLQEMELHLLLAFDVSASVNDEEFDLQRAGTASAFRSGAVANAIGDAPGGIAVSIIQWSSITQQALGLDWIYLASTDDALTYADQVEAMPRHLPGGGTMIHAGLDFAARQLDAAPGAARRRVIDLSGNGQADDKEELLRSRDQLLSRGVIINGLAIEEDLGSVPAKSFTFAMRYASLPAK